METNNDLPIFLMAKDEPCECHVCVQSICHIAACQKPVFQTEEKMTILKENEDRAFNVCPSCMDKIMKSKNVIPVNIDKPMDKKH